MLPGYIKKWQEDVEHLEKYGGLDEAQRLELARSKCHIL